MFLWLKQLWEEYQWRRFVHRYQDTPAGRAFIQRESVRREVFSTINRNYIR